jgi:hypothetical protein
MKEVLKLHKNFLKLAKGLLHEISTFCNAHKFLLLNVCTAYFCEAARDEYAVLHNAHHMLNIDQQSTYGLPMNATVLR